MNFLRDGQALTLISTDGAWTNPKTMIAHLPVRDILEEGPQKVHPQEPSHPKVVNGRYVYDDSSVTSTPR